MGRLQKPMTGMDDVERQAIHGDPEILEQKNKAIHGDPEILERKNNAKGDRCCWCAGVVGAVVFLGMTVPALLLHLDVHYSVAIDSVVSGPDPARGLSFNLTLGVSSWSLWPTVCVQPGTYVDVSYRGVRLAASEPETETGRLCTARPWKKAERPWKKAERGVAAVGVIGVDVGKKVRDGLAAELEQGVAVFDVALHLPAGSYGMLGSYDGESCVSQCGGRRVGAAAAWCDAPNQMPELGM